MDHFSYPDFNYAVKLLGEAGPERDINGKVTSCLVKGTLVKTDTGFVPIEKITNGNLVWSRDDKTSVTGLRKVVRTFITPNQTIHKLNFKDINKIKKMLEQSA